MSNRIVVIMVAMLLSLGTSSLTPIVQPVLPPIDWWPMFHHDSSHAGYSTSDAPNTNHTLWSYATGAFEAFSSPAVADGKVYVGSSECGVSCLDAADGTRIWTYEIVGWSDDCSSPAVAVGIVYALSIEGVVYAFGLFPPSVGGLAVPVDKLGRVAPWISFVAAILAASAATVYVERRRKKQ